MTKIEIERYFGVQTFADGKFRLLAEVLRIQETI